MLNPRDRLWVELIFPHCEPCALLALRASCRSFHAQLDAAPATRLWLPLTAYNTRMRHDERALGWRGVEHAMAREARTRANCDAGRFERVPLQCDARMSRHVAGRVVVFCVHTIELFDAVTGAPVGSIDGQSVEIHAGAAILDRFVPFVDPYEGVKLVDCATARLVSMPPHDNLYDDVSFTVAGPCLSMCEYGHRDVTVFRVDCYGADEVTTTQVVRIEMPDSDFSFALCERGQSYLLYMDHLELIDLKTRATKRVFDWPTLECQMVNCAFFDECDFVSAGFRERVSSTFGFAAVRISDGQRSDWIEHKFVLLFHNGRALNSQMSNPDMVHCVDAVSGTTMSRAAMRSPAVDTSGALLWLDAQHGLMASAGVYSDKSVALVQVGSQSKLHCFEYGVCVVESEKGAMEVLRFDCL